MSGLRLTFRARLTLLYAAMFAFCGMIVIAAIYTLLARVGLPGPTRRPGPAAGLSASDVARCQSAYLGGNKLVAASCPWSVLAPLQAAAQREVSNLRLYSLLTLGVVIVLAAVLGWAAAGRALRPLHQIAAAARHASEHDLSARAAPTGPRDELRELAETFDTMLDRLQSSFETQQHFIANASHELRSPLAVMRTTVDVVADNPDSTPEDLRAMATEIRTAVDHAEQLISALLILARNERGLTVRDHVDLATVAEDVLDAADVKDLRVHDTLAPAPIWGDQLLAERLVANLVDNAVRYNTTAGEIWVSTSSSPDSSQLTVANTGPGVSSADADRILKPFQRVSDRTAHDGFGLGLAIVSSIAEIHGGSVTAAPRESGGLSVTVTIPSAATAETGPRAWDSAERGSNPFGQVEGSRPAP